MYDITGKTSHTGASEEASGQLAAPATSKTSFPWHTKSPEQCLAELGLLCDADNNVDDDPNTKLWKCRVANLPTFRFSVALLVEVFYAASVS